MVDRFDGQVIQAMLPHLWDMSTNDTSTPIRRVQAGSLQISVSYDGMVHDEDAGYPFSRFRVTIADPDHSLPGWDQVLMLDGDHWTLDEATLVAIDFLATAHQDPSTPDLDLPGPDAPTSYTDPSVRRALVANDSELRALVSILDAVHDAGDDPAEVLGRVDLERPIDPAALTAALETAPDGETFERTRTTRDQDHTPAPPGPPWTRRPSTTSPTPHDNDPRL
ncbi:hypothetical protein ACIGB8_17705 [Promicromonospora sukumoe]|uniref:hypothetical protein n=1 Tax=Promicromonospora sukumoe TaxID=88382 RepID=UPI0037C5C596